MTASTWPDPARPGVPLNPEKDGWHWLSAMYYNDPIGPPVACFWEAKLERWPRLQDKPGNYPVSCGFCYLGPCLTPDEVQNLRDDLASAERERAHQQSRADCSAAEHAREQAKREALQKRVAELEAALMRIEDTDPDEGTQWFHEVARAALGGKDE